MHVLHKFHVIVLFFLMLFQILRHTNADSSSSIDHKIQTRITGGYRPAAHVLAKHMVSIRMKIGGVFKHNCGGSIIKPRVILTAAHCVTFQAQREIPVDWFEISVGTPLRFNNPDTKLFYVDRILVYAKYDDILHKHDIALIYLTQDIQEDGEKAQHVEMISEKPPEGTICTAAGWGRILNKGPAAEEVTYVDLKIYAQKWCYDHFNGIYGEKIICGKGAEEKYSEKGVCHGDSGGPLFCNGRLAGIASLIRQECGSNGYVDVYTNVWYFLDWIENRATVNNGCIKLYLFLAIVFINLM